MGQAPSTKRPLLEKLQDLLRRRPGKNDILFCVGPEKKIVGAVSAILEAASPSFAKEYEDKWENAVIKDGKGIPLPEYDAESFQLFVTLVSVDFAWTIEDVKKLNLSPTQLLNLLPICRRFGIADATSSLTVLATEFVQTFSSFKDTGSFLKMSRANLKEVLANDDLGVKEVIIYECALSWAVFNCKGKGINNPNEDDLRKELGDCLFEIRFPTMTNAEFSNSKKLLTYTEITEIYAYIELSEKARSAFNRRNLPFKVNPRNSTWRDYVTDHLVLCVGTPVALGLLLALALEK